MASFSEQTWRFSMTANQGETHSPQTEAGTSIVDLEKLTEGICQDLHGQVDQMIVHQVLVDLLPKYQAARVLTFVPILIRRDAIEILGRQS
jgi:hypothetical protein